LDLHFASVFASFSNTYKKIRFTKLMRRLKTINKILFEKKYDTIVGKKKKLRIKYSPNVEIIVNLLGQKPIRSLSVNDIRKKLKKEGYEINVNYYMKRLVTRNVIKRKFVHNKFESDKFILIR
jgi:hypothetical protein